MEKIFFGDFRELKTMELKNPNMKRQIFYGDHVMLVKNIIEAHEVLPKHHHPHEQMTYVLEGTCDIIVNGDQVQHAEPGSVAYIPSDADHEVIVTGDTDLICFDIFSPVREDFIEAFEKEYHPSAEKEYMKTLAEMNNAELFNVLTGGNGVMAQYQLQQIVLDYRRRYMKEGLSEDENVALTEMVRKYLEQEQQKA